MTESVTTGGAGMGSEATVRGRAWLVTVAATGALALCTSIALWTAAGQRFDHWAMTTVVAGRDTHLAVLSVLGYVSIGALAVVTAASVAVALVRGEIRLAIAAMAVIGGANATTQLLKHALLSRSDLADGIVAHNSLPSGHTTVVAASLAALCLVSPAWLRPLALTAGAFAITLTGASTVVAGWHRPSDVLAAVLVALTWTALVTAVIGGPARPAVAGLVSSLLGSAAAIVFLIVIGVRPSAGWDAFVTSGLVLGSIAVVTAGATTAMDRISPAR